MKKNLLILTLSLFLFGNAFSQLIPNSGFENWNTFPNYSEPVGWTSYNSQFPSYPITVSQSTDTCVGLYSLRIQTMQYINGVTGLPDTLQGLAVSGTDLIASDYGFPCSIRPLSMRACVKYIPTGNDSAELTIQFTKFNIASGMHQVVSTNFCYLRLGSTPNHTNVTVPITFINNTVIPDTAIISLYSSSSNSIPMPGSTLIVDELVFQTNVEVFPIIASNESVKIFPNPTKDEIYFSRLPLESRLLKIFDITGKEVVNFSVANLQSAFSVKNLIEGLYLYEVSDELGKALATGKISVIK